MWVGLNQSGVNVGGEVMHDSNSDTHNGADKSSTPPADPETRIETLEAENEALSERLDALETKIENGQSRPAADAKSETYEDGNGGLTFLSRRNMLAALGVVGLGTVASESASAHHSGHDHLGETWKGNTSSSRGLFVYTTDDTNTGISGRCKAEHGSGFIGYAEGPGFTKGVQGRSDSPDGKGILGRATATSGPARGLVGRSQSSHSGSRGVRGYAQSSSGSPVGVEGLTDAPNGYGLYTPNDAKVDGTMEVQGDVQVSGVKNFVQTVSTDAGPKQVTYTSIESGKARTETSDVAEITDGMAIVELPDHFRMVTSDDEPLSVQITPYSDEKVHPQVTTQSTERIIVKDFGNGYDEYTFAYTVKGIRHGFEDQNIVSDL